MKAVRRPAPAETRRAPIRRRAVWRAGLLPLLFALTLAPAGAQTPDAAALYRQHCASCHGSDRLGGMGPALLPESLERLKPAEARQVIGAGRPATQMAGFADRLDPGEIAALAGLLYTPVQPAPTWEAADIRASRRQLADPASLADHPVFDADPRNLFVVVEAGDHHVSIVDGDRFEPIFRFASHYALHGGPKFSPDGRFVYFASRDGWLSKFDLWNLKTVAEVRAGLNTRNAAVSSDGRWVAVANSLPGNLAIFDADLRLIKLIPATSRDGKTPTRVAAVYDAPPRHSFIAALKDLPELWEIAYDEKAPPLYDGLVHDYRMAEAIATPAFLNPRRTPLDRVLDDFFFDQSYTYVMGASRDGHGEVIQLDIRRKIADLDLPGMPHLGSGITFLWHGEPVMASTQLRDGGVTVIRMRDWQVLKIIPTRGPGFFLRSHSRSPYAFVDAMMSPANRHILQVIDKESLEVVKELRAEPGQTLAHVEFTHDGRYALASLSEMDGALVIYDLQSLREIKRLPMKKPVGKYNVGNKLEKDEGTSH